MNPGAIYSKSGKGVQEASGKTSLLKRADRAVLSAIDGRATLGEVAQKVGKPFDAAFQSLIAQLDRDGFVREVSGTAAAAAPAPAPRPAAKPAAATPRPAPKPAAPSAGEDLDFTGIMAAPLKSPAKPAFDPNTTQRLQEEALYKARQEAEARAQEQRDRLRAEAEAKARSEAEAKLRAETEKRLREEAEAKVKAEAEAKAKAAREAALRLAAEAKAKAEAEARAKLEAERREREEAERKAREEAERAKREAEELRRRLEEERRAREEAERKAREEAERKEAERRAREEAERRAREEAERRAREEAERKAREEAERREAERKAREEAERKARAEAEAQMRRAREEAERKRAEAEARKAEKSEPLPELTPPPPPPAAPAGDGGGLDALMADLDSFTQRDEDERKAREAAEHHAREDKKRQLREEGERREREQAERERQEAEERRREQEQRREAEQLAREAEERRAREEAEREREEAEERAQRAREVLAAKEAAAASDDIGVTDDDLDMDDVRRDEAAVAKESRKARREREREQKRLEKDARERAREAAKAAARAKAKDEPVEEVKIKKVRRRRSWGRPVAMLLFLVLAAGLAALHVMPVPTQDYERAASAALGQPVRIGSARLSLLTGVQLNLSDVAIGSGTRVASARAYPAIGSLFGESKVFSRIELDGVTLRQEALGEALFARAGAQNFKLERIVVKNLKLEGPLNVPLLEADIRLANDASVRSVDLRGPENLLGQLAPKGEAVELNLTASTITLPFAPDIELTSFAMKGRATRHGMKIDAWGGTVLGGALSGTANLGWSGGWQLDGVVKVRGINAAAFAPKLLAEGYAEGSGKFFMAGADPGKLVRAGRVEGSFTIGKGVLGSFDLARAIRTDGREVEGSTRFVELNAHGTYDRGAVALRNVVIGAGALQAGASADISQSGALSGRIIADVRTPSQSLRATLLLGGTVKEPQVRN